MCNGIDNMGCGHVITDHTVDMGAEKRNFEGEEVCMVVFIDGFNERLFLGSKPLRCCSQQVDA